MVRRGYLGEDSVSIAEKMVGLVEPLAEWVAAGEYGITEEEKVKIGMAVSWRLIGKCLQELERPGRSLYVYMVQRRWSLPGPGRSM